MKPLVSVIIPCYNGEQFVSKAIESVLTQSYETVEVIVVDDGSTDDSLKVISTFKEKVRYEATQNQGAQAARNQGIALAKGEFVKFLDADDMLYPDCLTKQVAQITALPESTQGVVFGDAAWVDEDEKLLTYSTYCERAPQADPVAYILENSALTSCPLHRRAYLTAVEGFDAALHDCHENDLHLRLVLSGVEFFYYSGPVYKYRQHTVGERISDRAKKQTDPLAYFHLIKKHQQLIESATAHPLSPSVKRALAHRFWRYGRAVLREGYRTESQQYFEAAQALSDSDCAVGSKPYRLLTRLLGPRLSEQIMMSVKGGVPQ